MILSSLIPVPDQNLPFRRSHQKFVPDRSGCYVLANFLGTVLYLGLTKDLRRRMGEHLDSPSKTGETQSGRPVWFYWLEVDVMQINKIERGWMNTHLEKEGVLPEMNRFYSPTST